ncbi:MAG: hypothetical protein KatS3mg108_1011 [Isosphaeraceae bacterium]|jgi:hypothetical protein|nr:MAG: hypothetical protein KatS3mg108_1011 [Isosphaeraceae bacterium]
MFEGAPDDLRRCLEQALVEFRDSLPVGRNALIQAKHDHNRIVAYFERVRDSAAATRFLIQRQRARPNLYEELLPSAHRGLALALAGERPVSALLPTYGPSYQSQTSTRFNAWATSRVKAGDFSPLDVAVEYVLEERRILVEQLDAASPDDGVDRRPPSADRIGAAIPTPPAKPGNCELPPKTARLYREIVKAGSTSPHRTKHKRKRLAETFKARIAELDETIDPYVFIKRAYAWCGKHPLRTRNGSGNGRAARRTQ